ncbi:family 20 glycosylhydrolase [Longispora sp. NPDC051575]|uniref:family 20 glycosylhydrolase n=1 Tax=Longispora sp. NPDC051575 TaxID=3154943 RepID=UPI00342EDE28
MASALVAIPPSVAGAANPAPVVVPSLRQWTGGTGTWQQAASTRIVTSVADASVLGATASRLAGELEAEGGLRPTVATGAGDADDIVLRLGSTDTTLGEEGYALTAGTGLDISARTPAGVLWGTRTLLQMLRADPARRAVPQGSAKDWPQFSQRGQMLDVGRKFFPVDYLKQQIRWMSWYKLNTFHLHLSDWNGFRVQSLTYPNLASPESYTQAQIRDLVSYAKTYGVTVVPELDLPAHASWISGHAPTNLGFGCASLAKPVGVPWEGADQGGWTMDVTKATTRDFIKRLLDEMIPLFDTPTFHIGGDEIPNDAAKAACPELVAYASSRGFAHPGDVFSDYVNTLNTQVRSFGRTTQLWEWWDYGGQQTSIAPAKNIILNEWLSLAHANAGYKTVGTLDGPFYVSPGFGTSPGQYGYSDPRDVYNFSYSTNPNVLGFKISRWNDRAQTKAVDWLDYFARRPLQAVADRTWGGPKAATFATFLDNVDRIGGAEPGSPTARSQTGWTLRSVTSAETAETNAAATNAFDNNPYTFWHTAYTGTTPTLPAEIVIDTGASGPVNGWRYLPRQDGGRNGRVKQYELSTATTATGPYTVAATGTLADDGTEKEIRFPTTTARYAKLRVLSEWGPDNAHASAAEIDLLSPAGAPGTTPPLADGVYTLTDGHGKALDMPASSTATGTQAVHWALHGGPNQQWRFTRNADGTYAITNVRSSLCLDVDAAATVPAAKVVQWTCTGTANQRWSVTATGNGLTLTAAHSNLALTVTGSADGAGATQETGTGAAGQRWTPTPTN